MKLNSLKLSNFRNYAHVDLEFNEHLNIIYGNNGVGKTNLVEAIYALSFSKSFRTNNDKLLIKDGEVSTKIEGEVEQDTTDSYQVIINKEGKKVKVNNNVISKLSDYITKINIVLLEPHEQIILSDSPSVRRNLINIEISQFKKDYIYYLNNYNKVLKQRNFYLRDLYINGNASKEYLDILTKKLVEWGKRIHELREDFINKINNYITQKYEDIFNEGHLEIRYVSDYKNKSIEEIINTYEKIYNREITLGKTLIGIHHDDIIFLLDGKNIQERGSNGQQKNAIFSFKLAEIEVIKDENKTLPILILDDLFSALDNGKIKKIISLLSDDIQTFITTTNLEKVSKKLLKKATIFKVLDGEVEKEIYER